MGTTLGKESPAEWLARDGSGMRIRLSSPCVVAGEQVNGEVLINAKADIVGAKRVVLYIRAEEAADCKDIRNGEVVRFKDRNVYFCHREVLHEINDDVGLLKKGKYIYPFCFCLSKDSAASCKVSGSILRGQQRLPYLARTQYTMLCQVEGEEQKGVCRMRVEPEVGFSRREFTRLSVESEEEDVEKRKERYGGKGRDHREKRRDRDTGKRECNGVMEEEGDNEQEGHQETEGNGEDEDYEGNIEAEKKGRVLQATVASPIPIRVTAPKQSLHIRQQLRGGGPEEKSEEHVQKVQLRPLPSCEKLLQLPPAAVRNAEPDGTDVSELQRPSHHVEEEQQQQQQQQQQRQQQQQEHQQQQQQQYLQKQEQQLQKEEISLVHKTSLREERRRVKKEERDDCMRRSIARERRFLDETYIKRNAAKKRDNNNNRLLEPVASPRPWWAAEATVRQQSFAHDTSDTEDKNFNQEAEYEQQHRSKYVQSILKKQQQPLHPQMALNISEERQGCQDAPFPSDEEEEEPITTKAALQDMKYQSELMVLGCDYERGKISREECCESLLRWGCLPGGCFTASLETEQQPVYGGEPFTATLDIRNKTRRLLKTVYLDFTRITEIKMKSGEKFVAAESVLKQLIALPDKCRSRDATPYLIKLTLPGKEQPTVRNRFISVHYQLEASFHLPSMRSVTLRNDVVVFRRPALANRQPSLPAEWSIAAACAYSSPVISIQLPNCPAPKRGAFLPLDGGEE